MSNLALQARRFGPVNWIGCWSLLRRQFRNGFSDLHYTILGPVISNALYLLLFYTPLLWWMASPLKVSAPPTSVDAIVVFAGGVGESGKAGGGFQERVSQAVALYKGGHASRVIFSSGFVFTLREAEVMKAVWADSGGVFRKLPPSASSGAKAMAWSAPSTRPQRSARSVTSDET